MKIERLSDNQIRCTLNKQDLMERQLRISELAYGTEKAKDLFRDMMQQASYEFGFEADDIPLMIEAIPLSSDSLVLVITKVEEPEELDTRFSKFSPDTEQYEGEDSYEDETSYADELLSGYDRLTDLLDANGNSDYREQTNTAFDTPSEDMEQPDFISLPEALGLVQEPKKNPLPTTSHRCMKVFVFQSLQEISTLAEHLVYSYQGLNSIYKDERLGRYYLTVSKSGHTPEEFNKICNIINEYGRQIRTMYASPSYFDEHFTVIVPERGLQVLASI